MPNPKAPQSNGTFNRANLRRAAAPAIAMPEPVRPAPPPAPHPQVSSSGLQELLKTLLQFIGVLAGVLGLLTTAFLMRDSMAVGSYLAQAKAARSTLVCQDGRMTHGDGSLHDMIFADSYFVCTDWRTLQAIELEEKPR